MKASGRIDRRDRAHRAPFLFVHSDEQWDALTSLVRLEMLQYLASIGPCSIAELALAMDIAPDGLYHHMRRLERAGLVRHSGDRHTGSRRERMYDAAAERLRYDVDIASGRNAGRLRALVAAHLDRAEATFGRAMDARDMRIEEPIADTHFESASAWLDDEAFERVRRHLLSALSIMSASRRMRRGRLFSLTAVLCPVARARGGLTRPTKRLLGMLAGGASGSG